MLRMNDIMVTGGDRGVWMERFSGVTAVGKKIFLNLLVLV